MQFNAAMFFAPLLAVQEVASPAKDSLSLGYLLTLLVLAVFVLLYMICLLYTSPSPRDATLSRMPSSA